MEPEEWDAERWSEDSLSTLPEHESTTAGRILRVAAVALMVALVAVSAVGLLGVRSGTARSSGQGIELEVHHAQIARPGVAAPFSITIRSSGDEPLPETLEVAVAADYIDMFDENGFEPDPDSSWSAGGKVRWTFEVPPREDELVISLDARIEPAVQMSKRQADVTVTAGGTLLAGAKATTWVVP